MEINNQNLNVLNTGFKGAFKNGFTGAETIWQEVATKVSSGTAGETYAWLGMLPRIREWLGDRHINMLGNHRYTILNKRFENTIKVPRTVIEDDQYNVFGPLMTEMGQDAAEFPDTLVMELLAKGHETPCYDGQYFFDTDHPVTIDHAETSASNVTVGAGPAWYLLDTTRELKPLIYQERIPFSNLVALNQESDQNVFMNDEFIYGLRGRANVGFGFWQMAHKSTTPLDAANYKAIRQTMKEMRGDQDRILGIKPTTLVCGPALESDALKLLNNALGEGGATNEWAGTAKVIVSPYIN